ncbi:MAG: YfaZ family outer membrane protein [Desulfobacterales bacterium]|nr:YfaZ family outer membrane protein [Desulfobacterales bacterium]MDX2513142.1 YfaZ family outer membrane protein [Desulfobacterales bacterium]
MQKTMKLIYVLTILSLVMATSTATARSFRFEMYANADDIVLGLESEAPVAEEAILNTGGGFIFGGEDYTIGNLHFALKSEAFIPALTLGLGLKGVLGTAEDGRDDYDLAGLGFVVLGEYDFRKVYYNFPLVVMSDITFAPATLAFGDTDDYTEFNLRVKGYIVQSAALVLGYKYIVVNFDKGSDDYKLSEDMIYFGFEFSF